MRRAQICFLFVTLLALAGCPSKGTITPHAQLTEDTEPLRSAFNADAGSVRVVMLVAPT